MKSEANKSPKFLYFIFVLAIITAILAIVLIILIGVFDFSGYGNKTPITAQCTHFYF